MLALAFLQAQLVATPFQTALSLLQGVTWPAILLTIWYVIRFLNKTENKLNEAGEKFDEMHKAVTNDMKHSLDEAVGLLRKQDQRWDAYMIAQATSSTVSHGIGH